MDIEELVEYAEGLEIDPTLIFQCKSRTPYDGCWWEYNYWLYKEGDLYPLYVSGRAFNYFKFNKSPHPWLGPTDYHEWLEYMSDNEARYDEWEVIDPEEWDCADFNKLNIMTAILSQHEVLTPEWDCSVCSETCRGLAKFLGYTGNGGIGINLDDPCCQSCYDELRWCDTCMQYVTAPDDVCPHDEGPLDGDHELSREAVEDEAEKFGLTARNFLGPDGDAEGLAGISIVIMQKGGEDG